MKKCNWTWSQRSNTTVYAGNAMMMTTRVRPIPVLANIGAVETGK